MMEGSSVYVRERGKLWRVCDLAVAPAAPPAGTRAESRAPTDNHCRMSSRAEGSLHTSLFQITLSFVVDHIHLVESLVGFPEQIGREVFAAAAAGHVFSRPNSAKALRLFADAYGDLLLGSLCLRHRFPLLHERMEEIRAFRCLKSLDLFGCRLGDHHEIFQHVTSLPNSLVQLSVGGNGLSDSGLQRLTAPVRMRRSGLDGLRVLDVSYNPVSEKALRYLTCLTKLSQLDVSQTEMRISAGLQRTMWAVLGLLHSHTPLDLFNHSGCRTGGWAEQWISGKRLDQRRHRRRPWRSPGGRRFASMEDRGGSERGGAPAARLMGVWRRTRAERSCISTDPRRAARRSRRLSPSVLRRKLPGAISKNESSIQESAASPKAPPGNAASPLL
ncbi:leucine-rich repeat-containing protein 42 isoform X5 [Oryzias melastigma]|uniref:leucine-rich repeat-containing protein 42 isoform X5 n=1 Tax=Oryzias melastigma TaxID=30732 RepID=UPI000CF7F6C5|nr:leucine-rich repeat-containing protein 42 isoform X5 [Oryzias melastigma]